MTKHVGDADSNGLMTDKNKILVAHDSLLPVLHSLCTYE